MTPLRQRMLHELQRRNYSASTIRDYLGAVRQFAEHFHCSPEQLGGEHLRHYQRYLLQEKKLEPGTVEVRVSALRFLYKRTLKRHRPAHLRQDRLARMPHCGHPRRIHEEDPPAYTTAQLCDTPAGSRRRPAHDSAADGP